jgi:hypothetical protein
MLESPGKVGSAHVVISKFDLDLFSLFCNAVQGCVIVETEISSMNDVICAGLFRQVVKRSQVSYTLSVSAVNRAFHPSHLAHLLRTEL